MILLWTWCSYILKSQLIYCDNLFDSLYDEIFASQVALVVKNPTNLPANAVGSIPGSARSPAEGHGNPLQ